jgi:hypothetical protein
MSLAWGSMRKGAGPNLDLQSFLLAAAIGAVIYYLLVTDDDSTLSRLGKGAMIGGGVQFGVRLLKVS